MCEEAATSASRVRALESSAQVCGNSRKLDKYFSEPYNHKIPTCTCTQTLSSTDLLVFDQDMWHSISQ